MRTIRQKVFIDAKPKEIYEAYTDAKKHSAFTGGKAHFNSKVGGKFDIWDGSLTGENVELIPGKKIVQKWQAEDWPEGHYSILTIDLFPEKDGTKLVLTQVDVPDDKFRDINSGWYEYYWEPMKKYFKKGSQDEN